MRGLFRKFGKHPRNEKTPGAGNPPVDNSNAKRVVRITLPDYTGIPVRSPVPPYDPHAKIQVKRSETHKEPARVVEKSARPQTKPERKTKHKGGSDNTPVPLSILPPGRTDDNTKESDAKLRELAASLEHTLLIFGIEGAKVDNIIHGPTITRFEVTIGDGVKVSRVKNLENDIALRMAASTVRIEAPIPGKSAIGIEIPNKKKMSVSLREVLDTQEFMNSSPLTVGLGKDVAGKPLYCDLAKMPHLLVAGATGAGKSVCLNSMLVSILCKASYKEVRMIMIDPKRVELPVYNGIPHLLMPVVVDKKLAAGALKWAVGEMERRYELFAQKNVRSLAVYNECLEAGEEPLPLVVILIDELADLMTEAKNEVEPQIGRLAAMARACGMHLIIATQRPDVKVITGTIKSNIPSRIALSVASGVDSRTILGINGAEKLLGKGDMLYCPQSAPKPIRGQGAYIDEKDVAKVVEYLKERYETQYDPDINDKVRRIANGEGSGGNGVSQGSDDSDDELFNEAVRMVLQSKGASVSMLQRRLRIGYPRAGNLIDDMEKLGIVGPIDGSKPRRVLITETEWLEMQAKNNE